MISNKREVVMEIKMEDIPDNMIAMVEIIGMEEFIELSKLYGGDILYIPSYRSLKRQSRNRQINMEYDGFNARELSQTYDLSVGQIHRITRSKN